MNDDDDNGDDENVENDENDAELILFRNVDDTHLSTNHQHPTERN